MPLRVVMVLPVWNEAAVLPALKGRLLALGAALEGLGVVGDKGAEAPSPEGVEWGVVMVDDGSTDGSGAVLREWAEHDAEFRGRFRGLSLSRNFGHQPAIMAGLTEALAWGADAVVVMDADLQDPPELVVEMVGRWLGVVDNGAEAPPPKVVRAVRRRRAEGGARGLGMRMFKRGFGWLSGMRGVADAGVFALMDRCVVEELVRLPERNRFLPGLRSWVGFEQDEVVFDRPARAAGEPKQSFIRLTRYALDAVFSFSYKPLRLMTLGGLLVSGVGFLVATGFALRRLLGYEIAQTGFTTLVCLVLFLGGIQLVAVGVLGEYIARVYDEVKGRPMYVVKRRMGVTLTGDADVAGVSGASGASGGGLGDAG